MPITKVDGFRTSDGTFFTAEDGDKAEQYELEYEFRADALNEVGITAEQADLIMMRWNIVSLRAQPRPIMTAPTYNLQPEQTS